MPNSTHRDGDERPARLHRATTSRRRRRLLAQRRRPRGAGQAVRGGSTPIPPDRDSQRYEAVSQPQLIIGVRVGCAPRPVGRQERTMWSPIARSRESLPPVVWVRTTVLIVGLVRQAAQPESPRAIRRILSGRESGRKRRRVAFGASRARRRSPRRGRVRRAGRARPSVAAARVPDNRARRGARRAS